MVTWSLYSCTPYGTDIEYRHFDRFARRLEAVSLLPDTLRVWSHSLLGYGKSRGRYSKYCDAQICKIYTLERACLAYTVLVPEVVRHLPIFTVMYSARILARPRIR